MRRIRHVVLPVRSWHYIGLLIVSLACLTLGLVSRDREGHAGSLAGPELIHQAPHESDSCPNLNPFTKMPSTSVSEEILRPVNEIKVSRVSPISRQTVFSRSKSLDRSSRLSSRETRQSSGNRDLLQTKRISRSRTRVSNDESANRVRESRSSIIVRSRDIRSSYDPAIRLSRSRDLSNRATDRRSADNRLFNSERRSANRFNNRRLQSTERHGLNEVAQNRAEQSMNRQVSPNRQRRTNDLHERTSLSIERRILSNTNRQESRAGSADRREYRDLTRNRVDGRSEMRDHRSRFVEQRAIERRESERFSRRRTLLNRSAIVSREDLNLQTRERSLKNRRVLLARVANQEHTSRSAARDYRDNLVIPNDRRSLSRSIERLTVNDVGRETLRRQARSVDNKRSSERKSSERRNLARTMEKRREMQHAGRRKLESKDRLTDQRSFDRATSQVSPEHLRQERVSLSQRSQDSRGNKAIGEQSRSVSSRSRYNDLEENANQKRQARFSRSVDRNSMDQRSRSSRNSPAEGRDLTLARRERTNRLYRFREERETVLQRFRETERRMSGKILERRVLERRVAPDSARLDSRSDRRIDNSRSREEYKTRDQRLDSRMSYEKMVEKRSARDSQKSTGRKIDARLSERSRMEDRRLERSLESRLSRGRVLERRSTLESRRSFEQRIGDSSRSREESRMANRRLERNLESRASRNRMLEKRTALDSTQRSIDRRTDESSRLHESRIQNRRLEQNSELRNSIAMRRIKRAVNSRPLLESRISRLSDKRSDSRNLQDMRADKNIEVRKIVPKIIEDFRLHNHSVTYDFLRQAFLLGLCTVYGLSLYGKKSFIGNNITQQALRFLVW
ncbi:uncharacterized protein LOC109853530 [Pseudomyrmex gracilis]|uniref:uncharacterized protein LOC109853530 n=1 Tax=Pseudomyrmex gracilis TaxID=219809 RepID=UPI000995C7B5|nr:uncharacterized protein LOC109853530 [Pseudomyrmex gracilis]